MITFRSDFHYFYILHLKNDFFIYHIKMTSSGHANLHSPKTPGNMPESPNRPPLHPVRTLGIPAGHSRRYEKHTFHLHVQPERLVRHQIQIARKLVHLQVFLNRWLSVRPVHTEIIHAQHRYRIDLARSATQVLLIRLHNVEIPIWIDHLRQ